MNEDTPRIAPSRSRVEVKHYAAINGVVIGGSVAHTIARILREAEGGIDGISRKLGLNPKGRETLFGLYATLDDAGARWLEELAAQAREGGNSGNAATAVALPPATSETWINTTDAAALLRVKERRVLQLRATGELEGYRFGRRWSFDRREVLALRDRRAEAA